MPPAFFILDLEDNNTLYVPALLSMIRRDD